MSQKQKRAHWLFSGTSLHKDLERCKESMALVTHLDETQFGNSWIVGQITQKPTKTKQTTQLTNTPNKNTNSKQKTNVMNTQTRVHAGGTNKRAHKHITTTRTIISQLMLCVCLELFKVVLLCCLCGCACLLLCALLVCVCVCVARHVVFGCVCVVARVTRHVVFRALQELFQTLPKLP